MPRADQMPHILKLVHMGHDASFPLDPLSTQKTCKSMTFEEGTMHTFADFVRAPTVSTDIWYLRDMARYLYPHKNS